MYGVFVLWKFQVKKKSLRGQNCTDHNQNTEADVGDDCIIFCASLYDSK